MTLRITSFNVGCDYCGKSSDFTDIKEKSLECVDKILKSLNWAISLTLNICAQFVEG